MPMVEGCGSTSSSGIAVEVVNVLFRDDAKPSSLQRLLAGISRAPTGKFECHVQDIAAILQPFEAAPDSSTETRRSIWCTW